MGVSAPISSHEIVLVHWRMTASNTDGHQEGDIDFRVLGGADASTES
jgi:hypothetical protein